MKISSLFELNLALSFWEIMKKELGARAIALPPSFVVTLFVSWSASRSKNVVLLDKATVRMPFVMGFSLLTRLLLFVLLLGTLKLIPKNTGSSLKLYGLRRSPRHWYDKIDAILLSIGLTPSLEDPCLYSGFVTDPKDPSNSPSEHPLTLGLTLTTLSTSLKIPPSNPCFAAF
jgi:hypothetical protein